MVISRAALIMPNQTATVASMNSQLQDLKSYLAPMVATWEGQAAQNYNAKQAQWDQAANDLNEVLAENLTPETLDDAINRLPADPHDQKDPNVTWHDDH